MRYTILRVWHPHPTLRPVGAVSSVGHEQEILFTLSVTTDVHWNKDKRMRYIIYPEVPISFPYNTPNMKKCQIIFIARFNLKFEDFIYEGNRVKDDSISSEK